MTQAAIIHCSAIAVAIGESIFSDTLGKDILELAVPIPPEEVLLAGATGIRSLSSDTAVICLIQDAYCYAFHCGYHVFCFGGSRHCHSICCWDAMVKREESGGKQDGNEAHRGS